MPAFDDPRSGSAKSSRKRALFCTLACSWCVLVLALVVALRPEPVDAIRSLADPPTPTPLPGTGSVLGTNWDDKNGNGLADPGEPPLASVLVTAENKGTGSKTTTTSGADGKYLIAGLTPGLYAITATPPGAYVLTTPASHEITLGADLVYTFNFGAQQPPTPTPSPTSPPLLDTSNAENLVCGGVYSGGTEAMANNVSHYGCKPWWDESGKEVAYRLQLNSSQPVTVTLLNATADLDLFLLRNAYPDSCVAWGDSFVSYSAEPGAYFLSIDGYQGAQGNYTFRVDCTAEVQSTPTPTFTPSATPTATQTGTPTPTLSPSPGLPVKGVYLPLVIRQASGSIPVTFTLQDGLDGYGGTTDTTLNSSEPTMPQGDDEILALFYSRKDQASTQKGPVLRFDLALLPPAAVVQNARLRLYAASTPLYDVRAQVQGLLRPWDEASATWQLATANQHWAQPGASAVGSDRTAWASDVQRIVEGSRWYQFDVTSLVQEWAHSQAGNHGFILSALAGDSDASVEARFVSREGVQSFRPQLVVSYTLGSPTAQR